MRFAILSLWIFIFFQVFCISAQVEAFNEKFVSLKDLEIYASHPSAAKMAQQLEEFARNEIPQLHEQNLLSIRPQMNFAEVSRVDFVLVFLHSAKPLRKKSLIVKISSQLSENQNYIKQMHINQITPITKTRFSVEVSLIDLKAKIVDEVSQSVFIYPVGGSAFDEGVLPRTKGRTIFASPAFSGTLAKSAAIESRNRPSYYQGKPFLRIIPEKASYSLYGFHTTPYDYRDKSKPAHTLARGYISAGCLRLKDDDLVELYQLIAYGEQEGLPVSIKHYVAWTETHPYPVIREGYHRVKGFCWKKGEGSSKCLSRYEQGARPVFSTEWVEKSPQFLLQNLYQYTQSRVNETGFEID